MRGLCNPELINQAIQRAGEVSPAFPVVHPATPVAWAISAADRHRLVKASKCPTKDVWQDCGGNREKFETRSAGAVARHAHTQQTGEILDYRPAVEVDHSRERVAHGTPGAWAVIEQRKWANEYRVRSQVETTAGNEPPENSGPRITVDLSDRALRAMTDSAAFVAAERGGFTTFVTLTFDDEQRARLKGDKPETSIQREVSRCMDAWSKMYRRGMKRDAAGAAIPGGGVPGNADDFDYLWVVEVPKNTAGEDNPHCHLLMRWDVCYEQFKPWASRLEKAWGQGFAHIEKIKKGDSAGAYIAKAAGYLCKAQGQSDQGEVRGNRYGISESARAPGWETITKTQLDCMSQLIADIYHHLTVKHGPDYRERSQLNRARQSLLEKAKVDRKKTGKTRAADWITRQRKKIESRLEKVRDRLNALPVRCNQYQVILKGDDAFQEFMAWSQNPEYPEKFAPWLPKKPVGVVFRQAAEWRRVVDEGQTFKPWRCDPQKIEVFNPGAYPVASQRRYFHELRERFRLAKIKREAVTHEINEMLVEKYHEYRNSALSMWQQYQWCSGAN